METQTQQENANSARQAAEPIDYAREVAINREFLRSMHGQELIVASASAQISTITKPIRESAQAASKELRAKRDALSESIRAKEKRVYDAVPATTTAQVALLRKQRNEANSTFAALLQTLYDRAGVASEGK